MPPSTKLEAIALIVTITLLLFHFEPQNRSSRRYQLFSACLGLTFLTIVLNLLNTWLLSDNCSITIPLTVNYLCNTLYFFFEHLLFAVMAIYAFYLLFEHSADLKGLYIAIGIIAALCLILEVASLSNYWTHYFFYFENGLFVRGPLNKAGYIYAVIAFCLLFVYYLKHQTLASSSLKKLFRILPFLILIMIGIQYLYPHIMTNGVSSAIANLVFFISFQSNRIDQDSLTGLHNRHSFFQELALQRKENRYFHFILISLENMDLINRKYGIRKGDALLYMAGRYLENAAPGYKAYRFANTRFLLCGHFSDYPGYTKYTAERIMERFHNSWEMHETSVFMTAKLAHLVADSFEADDNYVTDCLEYTLAKARETEGNTIFFFDDDTRQEFQRNQYVLEQMRQALDDDRFYIHIQPLYHLSEGKFSTGEVLLRLKDEQERPISPAEFIPLAEQHGLIDDISWVVLKLVCKTLAEHPELPLETLSINMSYQQLTEPSFAFRFHSYLDQYGIDSTRIRIELTERTLSENPERVRSVMAQMTEKGLRFYLDDFGIGYSNLAGMMNYPFETVKLDSSLMQDIATDHKSYQVARLLVELLHNAGFTVVAEGLETGEQVDKASSFFVDRIQGYYFAKPMPVEELIPFLLEKQSAACK